MGRIQFTIRGVMEVAGVSALVCAWVRWQGTPYQALLVVSHSAVAWGLAFLVAFEVARRLGASRRTRGDRRLRAWVFAFCLLGAFSLAWCHSRVTWGDLLSRGFPYPDPALHAIERWLDARRPPPPGLIKIHGAYPELAFGLGLLTLAAFAASGFLLGRLRCTIDKRAFGPD